MGKGIVEWTMSELSLFFEGSEMVGRMRLSPEPYTDAERRVKFG
jgi:transposase